MKKKIPIIISLCHLLVATIMPMGSGSDIVRCIPSNIEPVRGISFFSPRSQTTNVARSLVGWHPYINRVDICGLYGATNIVAEYGQSTRPDRITAVLFNTEKLTISGTEVTNRGPYNFIADYFGLSPAFQSDVYLDPLIRNAQAIFAGYVGYNWHCHALYFRFQIPAIWTSWNFGLDEEVLNDGSDTPYPAQYMSENELTAPATSFTQALQGTTTFGDMRRPMRYGKINGHQTQAGLSDLQFVAGYNHIVKDYAHIGINFLLQTPTGNRPMSEYFFEPIRGNGKHWECGVGLTGSVTIWETACGQKLRFFGDANFTHLFATEQRRSFDLFCNGFGSRFMLVKEFDSTGTYTRNLAPLINYSTLRCEVSVDIQVDFALMFSYINNHFTFDFGYNGWIRSKENITLKECLPSKLLGLKGTSNVITGMGAPDNTTQSNATLFGDNVFIDDNPSPVFLRTDELYLKSAASPMVLTQKFFINAQHSWDDPDEYSITPFLGLGGEIEFEGINERNKEFLDRTTLNQWNLWFKGGIAWP